MAISGLITQIKRFATHDGPGIRTTIFLKGCPLRCRWCSNPEGLSHAPEVLFLASRCKHCGACVEACPEQAARGELEGRIDRGRCTLRGACVVACPHGALRRSGRAVTVDELVAEVEKDRPFYRRNGGLTLCGGEPLAQPELAVALLERCHGRGISTVLDTSGLAPASVVADAMEHVDLVLLDLKHMDPERHRAATGMDNALVLSNALLMAQRSRLRVTLTLVPGTNDSPENLRATARMARALHAEAVDLVPVHELGRDRYRQLGLPPPDRLCAPTAEQLRAAAELIAAEGVPTTIGRMM